MNYFVNGEKIAIDIDKRPFGKGSEGKLFKKNNILYKIYFDSALADGFGDKSRNHIGLIGVPTRQIDLPISAIYDEDSKYIGYTVNCITSKPKDSKGIIKLQKELFLKNIETLLKDLKVLSDYYILVSDLQPANFIFYNDLMYLIDPGRYRFVSIKKEQTNLRQFKELVMQIYYLDMVHYKVDIKRKIQIFKEEMKKELENKDCYEYFFKRLNDYNTFEEYSLEKVRYIK